MENKDRKAEVERKRKIGKEYYALLSDYSIANFLEDTWKVLFHSSSLKQYPDNPERALNAIDMLIDEAERRFGHVEPAPISTFLYNRDMTNADAKVKHSFEDNVQDKSPDNHPEFAAREAKIFALLSVCRKHFAEMADCWRQGKGYRYYDDGYSYYDEYKLLGFRGEYPFANVTLRHIEECVNGYIDEFHFYGNGKRAITPFRCSGEYKEDASGLLGNRKEGVINKIISPITLLIDKVKQR